MRDSDLLKALAQVVKGAGPSAGHDHCRLEKDAIRELEGMAQIAADREDIRSRGPSWREPLVLTFFWLATLALGIVLGMRWA